MNPILSVIIPTYNRLDLVKILLNNVIQTLDKCDFEYEIVVSDNASVDGTQEYFLQNPHKRVRYFRIDKNIGCSRSVTNALNQVKGEFIYCVLDDDDIGESIFFQKGIDLLKKGNIDYVFGRLETRVTPYDKPMPGDNYPFKPFYTSEEYLQNWFDIVERTSSACSIIKKDLIISSNLKFMDLPFIGGTIDYAIHYEVIKNAKKIAFIDHTAFIWTISQPGSISGENRLDLMWQLMNTFAFPMANFSENRDYDIDFFNKYILNATQAILSSYCIGHNEIYFFKVENWIIKHNIKTVYIFGRGEVGIMLNAYLKEKGIHIKYFIDDNIQTGESVKFEEFQKVQHEDNTAVIIATYKCEMERKISRKFLENDINNLKVLSLFALTQED